MNEAMEWVVKSKLVIEIFHLGGALCMVVVAHPVFNRCHKIRSIPCTYFYFTGPLIQK